MLVPVGIELDGDDGLGLFNKGFGDNAFARADLENSVPYPDSGVGNELADQFAAIEKILGEFLSGVWKHGFVLSIDCRSRSLE